MSSFLFLILSHGTQNNVCCKSSKIRVTVGVSPVGFLKFLSLLPPLLFPSFSVLCQRFRNSKGQAFCNDGKVLLNMELSFYWEI